MLQSLVRRGRPLTVSAYLQVAYNEGVPDDLDDGELELLEALREHEEAQRKR